MCTRSRTRRIENIIQYVSWKPFSKRSTTKCRFPTRTRTPCMRLDCSNRTVPVRNRLNFGHHSNITDHVLSIHTCVEPCRARSNHVAVFIHVVCHTIFPVPGRDLQKNLVKLTERYIIHDRRVSTFRETETTHTIRRETPRPLDRASRRIHLLIGRKNSRQPRDLTGRRR